jgi:hypothetical protein
MSDLLKKAAHIAALFVHNRLYKPNFPACSYHSRDIAKAIIELGQDENFDPDNENISFEAFEHQKNHNKYQLIGFAKMQSSSWEDIEDAFDESGYIGGKSVDMRDVAVYVSLNDGSLWVRPKEEFEDGRFKKLIANFKLKDLI